MKLKDTLDAFIAQMTRLAKEPTAQAAHLYALYLDRYNTLRAPAKLIDAIAVLGHHGTTFERIYQNTYLHGTTGIAYYFTRKDADGFDLEVAYWFPGLHVQIHRVPRKDGLHESGRRYVVPA